jgi:hypothetical protein
MAVGGEAGDSKVGAFVLQRCGCTMGPRKIGEEMEVMGGRRYHQIDQLEPVDFEPFVFADDGARVRAVDGLERPGVEIHEGECGGRGANDGEGCLERPTVSGVQRKEAGPQEGELAEDVGVVDVLKAGEEGDAEGPIETGCVEGEAGVGGDPFPDEQEERDVPGVRDGDVVGRLGEDGGGESVGEGGDEGPGP